MSDNSIRLNQEDRRQIKRAVEEKLFVKEYNDLAKRKTEVAVKVLELEIPANLRRRLMAIPDWKNFVYHEDELDGYLCLGAERLNFKAKFPKEMPVTHKHRYNCQYAVTAEIFEEALALQKERDSLDKKKNELLHRISGVLASSRTVKALLKQWPDAKGILPAYYLQEQNKIQLPVLAVGDLTDQLKAAGIQFEEPVKLAA